MKKTILTIVTFISLLFTTALVSANYNFTAKDTQLINALTQKVEQVISEKGEKFRTPLVEGINKLSLQYKKNTRVSNILKQVSNNIDNSFEKDFEKILDGMTLKNTNNLLNSKFENYPGSYKTIIQYGISVRVNENLIDNFQIKNIELDKDITKNTLITTQDFYNYDSNKFSWINIFRIDNLGIYNQSDVIKNFFISKDQMGACNVYILEHGERYNNIFNLRDDLNVYIIKGDNNCFGSFPSAPNLYFIFKAGDYSKFLLINTTQDPYPFNPVSIDF